ncbi:MAG: fibronectin type III domain-containing protein [Clostridiales bacterium]|nr:fibronectin type III domain-containing protein [Clostridiales bacterium]
MKKIKNLWKLLAAGGLLLVGLLLFAPADEVSAASITQTGQTQTKVTIAWDQPDDNVTKYDIYYRDYNSSSSDYTFYKSYSADTTSATITGLSAGSKYYVRIYYDYTRTYSSGSSTYSSYMYFYYAVTLPGKVTGLKQNRWWYFALEFDPVWDKQNGVDGYQYIVYKSNGKKFKSGTTSSAYCYVDNISNSQIYTMKVRAYTTINGTKYYGAWSKTGYFFTQPRIKSVKATSGKLTIKWGKVSGATSYNIYVSTKKTSGYKKVKTVSKSKNSVTIKKFNKKKIKKNKTYYVYVQTVKKTSSGTYTSGRLYYWNSKDTSYGYF